MNKRKVPHRSTVKRLFIMVAFVLASVMFAAYRWAAVAKILSGAPPTMSIAVAPAGHPEDEPNCNVVQLSFRSEKPISSLSVEFHFVAPIHSAIVIYSLPSGKYEKTGGSYEVHKPCQVSTKSNGGDGPLKFLMSSDGYDVRVNGNSILQHQDQTFIGGILHNSPVKVDDYKVRGNATYLSYGHELPARLVVVDAETGGQTVLSDDAP